MRSLRSQSSVACPICFENTLSEFMECTYLPASMFLFCVCHAGSLHRTEFAPLNIFAASVLPRVCPFQPLYGNGAQLAAVCGAEGADMLEFVSPAPRPGLSGVETCKE